MDIGATLKEQGLQSVLIVDDAYEAPTPLKISAQAKGRFVRLVRDNEAGAIALRAEFPDLDTEIDDHVTGLLSEEGQLGKVWRLYSQAAGFQWIAPAFRDFEEQRALKRAPLLPLEAYIKSQHWPLETRSSLPEGDVGSYGLVFIDFFLDTDSLEVALERSVEIGKKFTGIRESQGKQFRPLVFLISSRVETTRTYQEKFRQLSGIKGSFFRFIDKDNLTAERFPTRLERQLVSYQPAMLLADYLDEFRTAAIAAVDRLQQLELTDLSLLNLLRIEAENERLGNYLNWLLSEAISGGIQSSERTRLAAAKLDQRVNHRLDGHVIDPRNLLFEIYTNAVFRYDVRDVAGESRLSSVTFGDVYANDEVIEDTESSENRFRIPRFRGCRWASRLLKKVRQARTRQVYFAVLSPTSDILRQRQGSKPILCVKGEPKGGAMPNVEDLLNVELLGQEQHVLDLSAGASKEYRIIKWSKKDLQSIPLKELSDRKRFRRVARLQPLFAHQLKHVALSDLGRVGVPTAPAIVGVLDGVVVLTLPGGAQELKTKDLGIFAGIIANKRVQDGEVKIIAFSMAFLDEMKAFVDMAVSKAGGQEKGKLEQVSKICENSLAEVEIKEREDHKVGNLVKIYIRSRSSEEEQKPVLCEILLSTV